MPILRRTRDVGQTPADPASHAEARRHFGASGYLPLGVALLLATVGGALLVGIIGVAQLTQLRLALIRGGELTPNAGSRGFGRSECDA